jgi:hypothetical protein
MLDDGPESPGWLNLFELFSQVPSVLVSLAAWQPGSVRYLNTSGRNFLDKSQNTPGETSLCAAFIKQPSGQCLPGLRTLWTHGP